MYGPSESHGSCHFGRSHLFNIFCKGIAQRVTIRALSYSKGLIDSLKIKRFSFNFR